MRLGSARRLGWPFGSHQTHDLAALPQLIPPTLPITQRRALGSTPQWVVVTPPQAPTSISRPPTVAPLIAQLTCRAEDRLREAALSSVIDRAGDRRGPAPATAASVPRGACAEAFWALFGARVLSLAGYLLQTRSSDVSSFFVSGATAPTPQDDLLGHVELQQLVWRVCGGAVPPTVGSASGATATSHTDFLQVAFQGASRVPLATLLPAHSGISGRWQHVAGVRNTRCEADLQRLSSNLVLVLLGMVLDATDEAGAFAAVSLAAARDFVEHMAASAPLLEPVTVEMEAELIKAARALRRDPRPQHSSAKAGRGAAAIVTTIGPATHATHSLMCLTAMFSLFTEVHSRIARVAAHLDELAGAAGGGDAVRQRAASLLEALRVSVVRLQDSAVTPLPDSGPPSVRSSFGVWPAESKLDSRGDRGTSAKGKRPAGRSGVAAAAPVSSTEEAPSATEAALRKYLGAQLTAARRSESDARPVTAFMASLLAVSVASAEAARALGPASKGAPGWWGGAVVCSAINQLWVVSQRAIRPSGPRQAVWWLQLVPLLVDVAAVCHTLATEFSAHRDARDTVIGQLLLESSMLVSSMLYVDEEALVLADIPADACQTPAARGHRRGRRAFMATGESELLVHNEHRRSARRGPNGISPGSRFTARRFGADAADRGALRSPRRPIAAEGADGGADAAVGVEAEAELRLLPTSPLVDMFVVSSDAVKELERLFPLTVASRSILLDYVLLSCVLALRTALRFSDNESQVMQLPSTPVPLLASSTGASELFPRFVVTGLRVVVANLADAAARICADHATYSATARSKRLLSHSLSASSHLLIRQSAFPLQSIVGAVALWYQPVPLPSPSPHGTGAWAPLRGLRDDADQLLWRDVAEILRRAAAAPVQCPDGSSADQGARALGDELRARCTPYLQSHWVPSSLEVQWSHDVLVEMAGHLQVLTHQAGVSYAVQVMERGLGIIEEHVVQGCFLSPFAVQMTFAVTLTAMRQVSNVLMKSHAPKQRLGDVSQDAAETRLTSLLLRFVEILADHPPLLLLNTSAPFLEYLQTLLLRHGLRNGQHVFMAYVREGLEKVLVPAIVVSLTESKAHDTAMTHEQTCEAALIILSTIARFVMSTETAVWGTTDSGTSAAPSQAKEQLLAAVVYCLTKAGRGGGKHSSVVPNVSLPVIDTDVTEVFRHRYLAHWALRCVGDSSSVEEDIGQRAVRAVMGRVRSEAAVGRLLWRPRQQSDQQQPPTGAQLGTPSPLISFLDHSNSILAPMGQGTWLRPQARLQAQQVVQALCTYATEMRKELRSLPPRFGAVLTQQPQVTSSMPGGSGGGSNIDPGEAHTGAGNCCSILPLDATTAASGGDTSATQLLDAVFTRVASHALRSFPFFADGVNEAVSLSHLVQFVGTELRRSHKQRHLHLPSAAPSITSEGSPTPPTSQGTASLITLDEAPLVVLDFIVRITSAGSWEMVARTIGLIEVSLKRLSQRNTALNEAAGTALLAQLRLIPTHHRPPIGYSFFNAVQGISDVVTGATPTLLGCERLSTLRAILPRPTRTEFRTLFYAIKQVAGYVEALTAMLRKESPQGDHWDPPDAAHTEPEAAKGDADLVDAGELLGVQSARTAAMRTAQLYLQLQTYQQLGDQVRSERLVRSARLLLVAIVVAFDLVLDAARVHGLSQDAIDDELRLVLCISVANLSDVLRDVIVSYLQAPAHLRTTASDGLEASIAWVALCVVATIGRVAAVDRRHVIFDAVTLRSVRRLLEQVKQLLEKALQVTSTSGRCPVTAHLHAGMCSLLDNFRLPFHSITRLSGATGTRRDVTMIFSALRAMASASARYAPCGSLVLTVWRRVQKDVCDAAAVASTSSSAGGELVVPALDELVHVVRSFADLDVELHEDALRRRSQHRVAEFVTGWGDGGEAMVEAFTVRRVAIEGGRPPIAVSGAGPGLPIASPADAHAADEVGGELLVANAALTTDELEALLDAAVAGELSAMDVAIDAVIRDSSRLLMRKMSTFTAPQSRVARGKHFENLLRLFQACPLARIVSRPRSERLFGSFVFFTTRLSPVSEAQAAPLWVVVERKWREEFVDPDEKEFLQRQRWLLERVALVRAQRRDAAHAADPVAAAAPDAEINDDVLHDVELPPFDDIAGVSSTAAPLEELYRGLPRRAPLIVTWILLRDLKSAKMRNPDIIRLVDTVTTYVTRQYFLLRPRGPCGFAGVARLLVEELRAGGLKDSSQWRYLPFSSLFAQRTTLLSSTAISPVTQEILRQARADGLNAATNEALLFDAFRLASLYLSLAAHTISTLSQFKLPGSAPRAAVPTRPADDEAGPLNAQGRWQAMMEAQTTPAGVKANLLENVMLHVINVSLNLIGASDALTRDALQFALLQAANRTVDAGGTAEAVALDDVSSCALQFSDEIRDLVATTFHEASQMMLSFHKMPSIACRAVHNILGSRHCGVIPHSQLGNERFVRRLNRPDLLVGSPTTLAIVSLPYFNNSLAEFIYRISSGPLTQLVLCLTYHMQQPEAKLAPLLSATTILLSRTFTRNRQLQIFCERLCQEMVSRTSFVEALAPPTVALASVNAAGSVSNEVLIPFVAAISRYDANVSKRTLAVLLSMVMAKRKDVFGLPPTANRQSSMAIVRSGAGNPTRASTTVAYLTGGTAVVADASPTDEPRAREGLLGITGGGDREDGEDVGLDAESQSRSQLLERFSADSVDATARSHQEALAGLNMTFPAVMELAMHTDSMRHTTAEERAEAVQMIRSADDARFERLSALSTPNGRSSVDSAARVAAAALVLENPQHFGVVMLHVRFAIRKVIHASIRRIASHQTPRTLVDLVEMLRLTDPVWTNVGDADGRDRLQRRAATGGADAAGPWSTANAVMRHSHAMRAKKKDSMLAGTLRVLLARAVACVDLAGKDDAEPGAALAVSREGLRRGERALLTAKRQSDRRQQRGPDKSAPRSGALSQ